MTEKPTDEDHLPAVDATVNATDPLAKTAVSSIDSDATLLAADAAGETIDGAAAGVSMAIAPGVIIAETYRVEALLGQGGMGAVWLASHLRLAGRKVAIKVLHGAAPGEELLTRFRHEAEAAAKIGHAHIVDTLDYNTLPSGQPYIVMEHLEGEPLSDALSRGALAPEEATRQLIQIAQALHAAHHAGVVHRDLKPDNVFLCRTDGLPTVKVLDFGISKVRDSDTLKTADAVVMGTPCYMSPEQAFGKSGEADARSDVFSLGAMAYEMVCGQRAFEGDGPLTTLYQIVHEEPPRLSERAPQTPAALVATIERALAKRPEDRFPDMAAFIRALRDESPALDATLAATEGVPRPVSTGAASLSPLPEPMPPEPGRVAVGFIVGAIVVAGVAWWGAQSSSTPPTPEVTTEVAAPPVAPAGSLAPSAPQEPVREAPPSPAVDAPPAVSAPPVVDALVPVVPEPVQAAGEAPKARRKASVERGPQGAPPALPATLIAAKKAFAAGRYKEALRQARKSLFEKKTSAAYVVMAKSHCSLKNLPDARGAIGRLSGGQKRRVKAYCRARGLTL